MGKCDRTEKGYEQRNKNAVGKMALIDLLNTGLPQTFNLLKKKKKGIIFKIQ